MNGNTRTQGRRGGTIKRSQMYMGKTRKKKQKKNQNHHWNEGKYERSTELKRDYGKHTKEYRE